MFENLFLLQLGLVQQKHRRKAEQGRSIDIDPSAAEAPGAARYRITGLRLLTQSGGRIFLLHDGWTPETGTVVVLPVDDEVRWQFSR